MNRTLERIVFMLIGATLAFLGYLVGGIDTSVNAQTSEKGIECDMLHVRKGIIVGDTKNSILLTAHGEHPIFQMNYGIIGNDFSTAKSRIVLEAKPEDATFSMRTIDSSEFGVSVGNTSVFIFSHYGKGTPLERNTFLANTAKTRPALVISDKLGAKSFSLDD